MRNVLSTVGMMPLSRWVPPNRKPPLGPSEGIEALSAWDRSLEGSELTLTAPEGPEAGRIVIRPRRRPVREPAALLAELAGGAGQSLLGTTTLEGEYAAMGTAATATEGFWLGAVLGDDFVYVVEGRAARRWGVRLGVVTSALVNCAVLGLGEGRPRAFLHDPGEGWTPAVTPGGATIWRSEERDAVITAHPAMPLAVETPQRITHRWLWGDPTARVRSGHAVAIATRAGLSGSIVVDDREHVVVVRDARHSYCVTLSGRDLDGARADFVAAVETIEPLPAQGGWAAQEIAQSHWAE